MQFLFRFDKPRAYQEEMLKDIYSSLEKRRSVLINAPTGIGKTDASLGAALSLAMEKDLNVFFLTPKISQHKIAMEALSGIKKRFSLDFGFIDVVGKRNLCVNTDVNTLDSDVFYSACESRIKRGTCQFYKEAKDRYMKNSEAIPEEFKEAGMQGHNSLLDASFRHGVCGYEMAAMLSKNARVVVADYAHLLNPYTKAAFLKKISHSLDNSIVIWDEAHNIIEHANSYMSSALSTFALDNAAKELGMIDSKLDLDYMKFALKKMAEKRLRLKYESFLEKEDMPQEISGNLDDLIEQLEKAGLEYSESRKAKRSALMHVARFFSAWKHADSSVARIISRHGSGVRITLSCLYPGASLDILKESYANIFMSATLLPLSMYAQLFGIDNVEARTYRSPFPVSNKIALIDDSVTTKYDNRSKEEYQKIAKRITLVKKQIPGNVAAFFPSFDVLEGIREHLGRENTFVQTKEMKSVAVESLLKSFKESRDSLLMGVMGGSLSEGIDYANNVIKGVIIVGVPLSKPNLEISARIEYLNKKFEGKGMDYAYIIPAMIRVVQAAGRAVRSEKDRAVIVFMDKRYRWSNYSSLIKNSIPLQEAGVTEAKIGEFWERKVPV